MTFTLDTSGTVTITADRSPGAAFAYDRPMEWPDLSPFAQGYIAAMLEGAAVFTDTDSDGWPVQIVTVIRPLAVPQEADAEAGPMFKVRAADGREKDAFKDELRPVAFSDLAPEALALILSDCERWIAEYVGSLRETANNHEHLGGEFWRIRQAGRRLNTFPPLRLYLDDAGKVQIEPQA